MSVTKSRYRTSAPPTHVSGLSNDTYDYVPRQTSYDEESFDADSSSDVQTSAYRRRKAPRGSKLSLGKREARGARRGGKPKGSSAAAAAAAATDPVSKAMSSAQRIQINELKNEIESLATELDEIKKENRVLKRTVVIHEKSLGKYEDKGGDLSQLMERHNQEIHALRELMKRSKDDNRKLTKALRDTQDELESTRKQLRKLQTLADSDNLVERDDLSKKLKAATEDLDRKNERVTELEKHIELLVKNHNRELNVETKRLRDVRAELEELQRKYDRVHPHSKVKENGHATTDGARGSNSERQHQHHPAGSASGALSPAPVEPRLSQSLVKNRMPRVAAGSSDEGSDQQASQGERTINAELMSVSTKSRHVHAEVNSKGHATGQATLVVSSRSIEEHPPARKPTDTAPSSRRLFGSGGIDFPEDGLLAVAASDHVRQADASKRSEDRNDRLPSVAVLADESSSAQQQKHERSGGHGVSEEVVGLRSTRHSVSERGGFQLTESVSGAGFSKERKPMQESNGSEMISFSPPPWNKRLESRQQPNIGASFSREQPVDISETKGLASFTLQEQGFAEPISGPGADERSPQGQPAAAAPNGAAAAEERRKKELLLQKMKEIDRSRGLDAARSDAAALLSSVPPADAKRAAPATAARGEDLPRAVGVAAPAAATAPGTVAALKPASERRDKLLKLLRIDPSIEASASAAAAAESGHAGAYQPSFSSRDQPAGGGIPAAAAAAPKKSNLITELFGDDSSKKAAKVTTADDDDLFADAAGRKQAPGRVGRQPAATRDAVEEQLPGAPAAARSGGSLLPLRAAADSGSLRGRPAVPRSFLDQSRDDDDIEELML